MNYRIVRDAVELVGGRRVQFDAPILDTLDLGSVLIVILDPGSGGQLPENVYAVDGEGRMLWRVQEFEFPHGRSPYTGAYVLPDGLALYNRCGVEALVDPVTGRILRSDFIR